MKRINITIDDDLLKRIDLYSKKRYVTRSGLISLALSTYLDTFNQDSFSHSYSDKPTDHSVEV